MGPLRISGEEKMALQLKELKELIIHVAGAANEQVCTPCEKIACALTRVGCTGDIANCCCGRAVSGELLVAEVRSNCRSNN